MIMYVKIFVPDVDECVRDANCSQACVNTYGSFYCECNVPGFILDDEDESSCISEYPSS